MTVRSAERVGYSDRIHDPAFKRYLRHTSYWSLLFAGILAVVVIVGSFIYGETSSEMDNPQALYIGLGIGGMFVSIALLTILGRARSRTWDGVVVDKYVRRRTRRERSGDNTYEVPYTEFGVVIRDQRGKNHTVTADDDDTLYEYYQVGEHVRHHKGLNTLEKYDKSRDSIIFCNACSSKNDIEDDKCFRCGCPLLK